MRAARRRIARTAAALLATPGALPPPPASAAFERPPLCAEAEGLGGMIAVSPDAVFGNPAGPPADPDLRLRACAARPFGLSELGEAQVSLFRSGSRFALGVGARRFGSEVYSEREIRLTGSWAPNAAVSLGAAARGLEAGGAFAPVRSFALDVAFRARSGPATEVGAVVEAVLGEVPGDPRSELRRTAFGIARQLGARTIVRVEVQRQGRGPLASVLGVEWSPLPLLTLRAGAREEPSALSGGFTVRRGGVGVSGSATWSSPLGRTLRVGLEVRNPEGDLRPGAAP